MLRFFFLILCFFSVLFAEDFETAYQATVDADSSAMVEGCVNVMTGQLYFNELDIVADGKQPIYYSKSYKSLCQNRE